MKKALGIFELAQFVHDSDQHVGIGADAETPAVRGKQRRWKDAVAEIGLGDRAQAGDGAAPGQRHGFGVGHVGGVDQAPALVDRGMAEQPLDRPRARPGEAVLDLAHLLGDVDVDRTVRRQRQATSASSSGVTARRLCGATPMTASGIDSMALRLDS